MNKLLVLPLVFLLTSCEGVNDIQQTDEEKSKAKTSETSGDKAHEKEEAKKDDIWTYYENAQWSDEYKGLKTHIKKVVVSDKAPRLDDNGNDIITSAVGVKIKIENTTDGKFTTYPDQATLFTSTGEQVEADILNSDSLGGEIDKGVIKEGIVFFYLERGNSASIDWVKFSWTAHKGGEDEFDGETKAYEVELPLK